MSSETWFDSLMEQRAAPVTVVIAGRVKALREEARLSGAALAERLREHGVTWNRTTVIKLESGARESVTVQELLALAMVLDVPPVSLIADIRGTTPVPLGNGEAVSPWVALMWLIGSSRIDQRAELRNYYREAYLIEAALDLNGAVATLKRVERGLDPVDAVERNERRHRGALEMVRDALTRIHAGGGSPPPLPDEVLARAAELDVDLSIPRMDG